MHKAFENSYVAFSLVHAAWYYYKMQNILYRDGSLGGCPLPCPLGIMHFSFKLSVSSSTRSMHQTWPWHTPV